MKHEQFPVVIAEKGVSSVIRKAVKIKSGKRLNYFIVEYILLGKRKQVWRSSLAEAKELARDACIKIANGDQSALELRDTDRLGLPHCRGCSRPHHRRCSESNCLALRHLRRW
jgi:hypothetical protein